MSPDDPDPPPPWLAQQRFVSSAYHHDDDVAIVRMASRRPVTAAVRVGADVNFEAADDDDGDDDESASAHATSDTVITITINVITPTGSDKGGYAIFSLSVYLCQKPRHNGFVVVDVAVVVCCGGSFQDTTSVRDI
jgi:hypothetical protein